MNAEKNMLFKLDRNISAYPSFFNDRWADAMHGLSSGTKLDDAVSALCVNWATTGNAFAMPFQMVHNLVGFEMGFLYSEQSIVNRIFERLAERIPQKMGDLSVTKRKQLASAIKSVGEEMRQFAETIPPSELQFVFDKLLDGQYGHELTTSIWALQRLCYGSLYYAYENFVVRCVGIARNKPDYSCGRINDFKKDVRTEFSDAVVADCFDTPVDIARLCRNALGTVLKIPRCYNTAARSWRDRRLRQGYPRASSP